MATFRADASHTDATASQPLLSLTTKPYTTFGLGFWWIISMPGFACYRDWMQWYTIFTQGLAHNICKLKAAMVVTLRRQTKQEHRESLGSFWETRRRGNGDGYKNRELRRWQWAWRVWGPSQKTLSGIKEFLSYKRWKWEAQKMKLRFLVSGDGRKRCMALLMIEYRGSWSPKG